VLLVKRLACGREEFLGKSDACCSTQQAQRLFQNYAGIALQYAPKFRIMTTTNAARETLIFILSVERK
jgi:hypothetical protein